MLPNRRTDAEANEPRYDTETLRKVTALAEHLRQRHQETLTGPEIEAIGREVGLDPAFTQEALRLITARQPPLPAPARAAPPVSPAAPPFNPAALAGAWWATGWMLPICGVLLSVFLGMAGVLTPIFFFFGLAVYIGGGIILSGRADLPYFPTAATPPAPAAKLSRAALLETMFALQRQLESQERRCAFLSVDVVGSSQMKREAPALAVEYSFRQFREWAEGIVRDCGGQLQSAAGDGMMSLFPADALALRAARQLQEGVDRFNAERNHLPAPFRLRCGVSAGAVAVDAETPLSHLHSPVIDRAAVLQKHAAPGDILVGPELAEAALRELDSLSRLPDPVEGEPAFSWRGRPAALPPG
jgi:class 3 adenylate cyclase